MAVTVDDDQESGTENQGVVFQLGNEEYCMDITFVDEIVERGELTPLPNANRHIEGVMDLRGETTTIFNPQTYFDVDGTDHDADRILILDQEDVNVGWVVDSVDRVIEFAPGDIQSNVSDGAVEGVLRRDDGFIIVVDPTVVEDTTS